MDDEIQAMSSVADALSGLDTDAQVRVLQWAASRYSIKVQTDDGNRQKRQSGDSPESEPEESIETETEPVGYDTFAELFSAANPTEASLQVLVAGYWFQVIKGHKDLNSASLNKELAHLGHKMTNINMKFDTLIGKKPQLALQLRKSGSAKQARKKYKLTDAGIKKVEEMINS